MEKHEDSLSFFWLGGESGRKRKEWDVIHSAFHANVNKLMKMETKVSLTTNKKIMMNDYGKYGDAMAKPTITTTTHSREEIGKQSNTHKLIKLNVE